jgi:predicted nucleic acid-binding protein
MRRVVLDTNSVLSALLFGAGRLTWVRQSWGGSSDKVAR